MNKLIIDDRIAKRLKDCYEWRHGAWKGDLARNVIKQGWISEKQLKHLFSEPYKFYNTYDERGGYDGAPDGFGNGYVTGE